MNFPTLRWLCALGCVCLLVLVKPIGTKRAVSAPVNSSKATVRKTVPTALQPAPLSPPRFLVADPHPMALAVLGQPSNSPSRFLAADPAPTTMAATSPAGAKPAPAPVLLPASFEPPQLPPSSTAQPFLPVVLSSSTNPEPTLPFSPIAQFIPALAPIPVGQPVPSPNPFAPSPRTAPPSSGGTGLTGLPELSSDGYWIENAPLNEIFQYLARRAEQQYFFNNDLAGPEFTVTGHLKLTDPKRQMEDLATAYGLTVHQQGSTIYLMNDAQLAKLPVEVLCYPLKYLRGSRPAAAVVQSSSSAGGEGGEGGGGGGGDSSGGASADFTKLMAIVKPLLTRDTGHIEFEEKNNVLLVTDNSLKLKKVHEILEQIDRPKQQIVINVRILRVRKGHGSKIGVDWTSMLGDPGLPITASQSLNAMFGLPDSATLTKTLQVTKDLGTSFIQSRDTVLGVDTPSSVTTINETATGATTNNSGLDSFRQYTDGTGLVFDALQMGAIIHALKDDNLITQEACPTIITEDNEQGNVSFVDRFPIVTSTIVATASGTNITDEVRYKIDDQDPNAANEPEKSREIGVTLSVTPTLLPDGTVRMRLRPRVAKIVELIPGRTGNLFPRVSESTVEGISRIPNGKSLFLGGFYDSDEDLRGSRVPVLGNIPIINKLFSYRDKSNEQISLVFIITPHVYDASNAAPLAGINRQVQWYSGFNRPNPQGTPTPLLPDLRPENGFLPLPVDRDQVAPPPGTAPPEKKRSWFGRVFNKKPPLGEPVYQTPPAVVPAQYRRDP